MLNCSSTHPCFQREFQEGECGEDKGNSASSSNTYGGWESSPLPRARAGVPYLCSSTRMAPPHREEEEGPDKEILEISYSRMAQGRARCRQGDKEILKIVEKNKLRPGMVIDKLAYVRHWHCSLLDGNHPRNII